MIVFFRISIYNFRLSGIAACPFVLAPTRTPRCCGRAKKAPLQKRLAALPAGEAGGAPPYPLSQQVLEKKRNREMNEIESS